MGANIKYKDSLFSFLFSDPDILRELYCALENVSLSENVPVTINTLSDVLFIERVNDISFEIGGKLVVLIEHQSTINPNMSVRLLLYISRIYEKIIGEKNIYTTKAITIPRPEFFVLYNGKAAYPDQKTIRLSDAFESTVALGFPEKESPALELEVKVININEGRNELIAKKCKTLEGYMGFIGKVRELEKGSEDREETMRKAVLYCRDNDILKEFLEKNGTEVMNMLMTEWKMEDALAVRYEEGREEGREEIARNALAKGVSVELIHSITGLDIEAIKNLSAHLTQNLP
jgi:predicted transposase YdaD